MNDLRNRLRDLASGATSGVSLNDPSLNAPVSDRSRHRRSLAFGLVAALAVATMLFLWQSGDSSTTSVIAAEGDESGAAFFQDGTCAVDPVLEVLRAGIPTYDYQPAGSYDALANNSAVVVAGQVVSIARNDVNGRSYIELTVGGVFEVPTASDPDITRDDIVVIAYEAQWADRSSPDPLASSVVADGLDFFGFLSPWSGVRGGWAPGPEGLYVSCSGQFLPVIANGAGPNDPADPSQWWAMKQAEQAREQAMAAAAAVAAQAAEEPFFHTVETGDRLGSIAEKYNVTVDVIIRANPQMDPNLIIAGERLRIPGATTILPNGVATTYLVQPGDTLGGLASVWTVSLDALLEANPGIDPAALRVGDVLIIPPWGTGLDMSGLGPVTREPGRAPLEHVVAAGDDIASIAELYKVTSAQIVNANGLVNNGEDLRIGQVLLIASPIPVGMTPTPASPATPEDLVGLQQATIELAQAQWDLSAIDSYRLTYAEFRPEGMAALVTVNVEDGVISASDQSADATGPAYTIDALFDLALSADTVREFEFDQQTGHPTVISVDPDSTVAGDEFAIRNIEVVSQQDIEAADLRIQDWLPEPTAFPESQREAAEQRGADVSQAYLLHDNPAARVYLYLAGDQICVTALRIRDGSEEGSATGTCLWKTDFIERPMQLSATGPPGNPTLLFVVVPLDYADHGWTAETDRGTLDVSERSALLVRDDDAPQALSIVRILCDCGDLTFTFPG